MGCLPAALTVSHGYTWLGRLAFVILRLLIGAFAVQQIRGKAREEDED
ncbi:MAG: hypothetical protein ACJ71T_01380 [Actinomycetales bacterium]